MFNILLLLLIFFIIFPLFRVIFAVWKTAHGLKKQYNDFTGANNQSSQRRGASNRPADYSEAQRKKVFDKGDGEYVEFEDIKIEKSNFESTEPPKHDTESPSEPQITDATFEEIK
ncbi:MAG: DUF4834 family protein [Muribaculaceae bacterium]